VLEASRETVEHVTLPASRRPLPPATSARRRQSPAAATTEQSTCSLAPHPAAQRPGWRRATTTSTTRRSSTLAESVTRPSRAIFVIGPLTRDPVRSFGFPALLVGRKISCISNLRRFFGTPSWNDFRQNMPVKRKPTVMEIGLVY